MIRKFVLATAMSFLIAVIPFTSWADPIWTKPVCGVTILETDHIKVVELISPEDGSSKGISLTVTRTVDGETKCIVASITAGYNVDDDTVICAAKAGFPCNVVAAAPPQKVIGMTTLKNFFQEAGMSKKHAQELVNKTVREIKLKKPGEEGERLIRLITQQPSPTKPRKLATKWAKIKSEH